MHYCLFSLAITYLMNILETCEHSVIITPDGSRIFPRIKHVVIVMIVLVVS